MERLRRGVAAGVDWCGTIHVMPVHTGGYSYYSQAVRLPCTMRGRNWHAAGGILPKGTITCYLCC